MIRRWPFTSASLRVYLSVLCECSHEPIATIFNVPNNAVKRIARGQEIAFDPLLYWATGYSPNITGRSEAIGAVMLCITASPWLPTKYMFSIQKRVYRI